MSGDGEREPIGEAAARDLRAHFAVGVAVVTSRLRRELHGVTVAACCFAALRPPLVLVCLERPSRSEELISESGVFAVNVVSWQQMFLADRFAGRGPLVDAQFRGVPHRLGVTGTPILEGALAWFECRVEASWPAGDHTVFVGRILDGAASASGDALVYFRRRYHRLGGGGETGMPPPIR